MFKRQAKNKEPLPQMIEKHIYIYTYECFLGPMTKIHVAGPDVNFLTPSREDIINKASVS
jgi:hypothetical protein